MKLEWGGELNEDTAVLPGGNAWSVRELELINNDCSNTWFMNALLQKLAHVTYLWIGHEGSQTDFEYFPSAIQWGPLTSLR